MITEAEPEIKEQELQQQAIAISTEADAIQVAGDLQITSQHGYDKVIVFLRDKIAPFIKRVNDEFNPGIKKAHDLHKHLLAQKNKFLAPAENYNSTLRRSLARWDQEQEDKRREEERKRQAEAQQEHDEGLLAAAIEAEKAGATPEEQEAILQTPNHAPAPVAPPTYEKAVGHVARYTWECEVVSKKELCRAIAEGKAAENLVEVNMAAVNQIARATHEQMNVPGLRAVKKPQVAIRTK